jgi:Domain of unknown function (DUF4184)
MPFPLAHPAAVLPLRRYCPRYLNFAALVVGSLTPDLGYAFGHLHVDRFSHQFLAGGIGFCLPVGGALMAVFFPLRPVLVRALPWGYDKALLPLCAGPAGPPVAIGLSLVIGAWTHIFLDDLAHGDGWFVVHVPALQRAAPWLGNEGFGVYDLVYAACTFLGITWLAFSYLKWLRTIGPAEHGERRLTTWGASFLLGLVILVIVMSSRAPERRIGEVRAGISVLLVVLGFVVATGWRFRPGR